MLHGFSVSKLVLLSTLIFAYWNASNAHILQYWDLCSKRAVHTQPKW